MRLYAVKPIGTVPRARQLRRDAPEPERRLLRALREALPQLKWRHQTPIGPYYVDIMCFSQRLVIEADGDTHVERDDGRRDDYVASQDFRTLGFSNSEVMENLDGVLAMTGDIVAEGDNTVAYETDSTR